MLKASYKRYDLIFKKPGGTSRGVLTKKRSYFIEIYNTQNPAVKGVGECSVLPRLSPEDSVNIEEKIQYCCQNIDDFAGSYHNSLKQVPALRFAIEMALLDLKNGGEKKWFHSAFTRGENSIEINGLIWMGSVKEMQKQVEEKLENGFNCLKLKIGALDFKKELSLLKAIRERFSPKELEVRVDANGAYSFEMAIQVLEKLKELSVHSIEQPIKAGMHNKMAQLCKISPVPIALDEELIGVNNYQDKKELIETIMPHYIILKPSLTGGFKSSLEWITLAEKNGVKWWITSALESNLGLNAIAQWCATLNNYLPQGLGTGQLFTNNVKAPLKMEKGKLKYLP
ncbi:o-succinylbenzoate synthase [Marinilabiliaceae bacterium ANBcel2]|nr:o-succinylbenzoate synthase [Marinilabiliaceae bacterium ANBcel2]